LQEGEQESVHAWILGLACGEGLVLRSKAILLDCPTHALHCRSTFLSNSQKIQGEDLLTLEECMHYVQVLFEEDGIRIHEHVKDIGDWKDFFGESLQPLEGLGTARRVEYKGRSIHCIRVTMGSNGRAAFAYKEHDTCCEPWHGHWSTQEPLQIFKDGSTHPDTILSHHRKLIDNLDLWSKSGMQ
jgi:hypothetical protein